MISDFVYKNLIDYLNKSTTINISIVPQDLTNLRDMSINSVVVVIFGSISFSIFIFGMWILFYKIQKKRQIKERERIKVNTF